MRWPDLQFPPINLWSAPNVKPDTTAPKATLKPTRETPWENQVTEHSMVHSPKHYKLFSDEDIEVIDVMYAVLTLEEFIGYLRGNVIKYMLRAEKKNGTQDLEKALKYLKWLEYTVQHREFKRKL